MEVRGRFLRMRGVEGGLVSQPRRLCHWFLISDDWCGGVGEAWAR